MDEVDYMNTVKQSLKHSMFWWSVTFFLFGNGSSYVPPVVMVTRTPPNFRCIQNNYRCIEVPLVLFPSIWKWHWDMTRSTNGDNPHSSVRRGSWSTRKLWGMPNSWGDWTTLKIRQRWAYLWLYKVHKSIFKKTQKQQKSSNRTSLQRLFFLSEGGNRNPGVPTVLFFSIL